MTAQQIVDREILYEQSYVLNELIRVNDSLWDKIENSNELDEVFEWWLVTPYMAAGLGFAVDRVQGYLYSYYGSYLIKDWAFALNIKIGFSF